MKQLTIRGMDPVLRAALEKEAGRRGLSLNRSVLLLLRRALGLVTDEEEERDTAVFDDLDHLAGTWSEEQAEEFEAALLAQRTVDEDLWR